MPTNTVSYLCTAVAAASLALIPFRSALADGKIFPAAGCQLLPPATASDVKFQNNGLYNSSDSDKRVVCPIVKDGPKWEEADEISDSNSAWLMFRFATGSVPGRIACTAYVGSTLHGGQFMKTIASPVHPASSGASANMFLRDPAVGGWHQASLVCTLGPKTTLLSYYMRENSNTDL